SSENPQCQIHYRLRMLRIIIHPCLTKQVSVVCCYDTKIKGFLTKRGAVVKNWKRRWCVIEGPKLVYYKSKAVRQQYCFLFAYKQKRIKHHKDLLNYER